jgi:ATP-binding cassette subfamily B protein IrtA
MNASSDQGQSQQGLAALLAVEPLYLTGAAIASTLAAMLALVPFFVVERIATAIYARPPNLDAIRTFAFQIALAFIMRYAFVAAANILAHVAAYRILYALRVRLARKLGEVPFSFFSRRGTGVLKKVLMDDVGELEGFVAHHFPDAVAALVVPPLTAIALIVVDWRMAIASVVMAPVAAAVMAISMRNIGAANARWNGIQKRVNRSMLEYFRGIHVAKTFGVSARRFGELASSIEEGFAWMETFMRTNGRGYSAFASIVGSSLLVLVPLGGWLYLKGSLPLESLVLFLVLGPQLLMSMVRLIFAWSNLDRVRASNARIQDILGSPELNVTSDGPRPTDYGIGFRNVGFNYENEERRVLSDVSFDVPSGKVTALVGPSGAGKTTLLRLVLRFWEVTEGVIQLGRVDVKTLPIDTLLSLISLVSQEVFLFDGTVRENLLIARPQATNEEIDAACRSAQAYDFIQALPEKYNTPLGERGATLSGGERQRLSIARALLKDAPVLLLDEATAFADSENEARIQDALGLLCRGRTVLVVAHRLSTIATADQIVVFEAGKVAGQGSHATLLEECALYQKLWRSHSTAQSWSLSLGGGESSAQEVA